MLCLAIMFVAHVNMNDMTPSFPLEECDSNPNKREYVKVMGYFNLSREAQGWTGLGCFTKFLHHVNTAYPQKNYVSCVYITVLYWQCAVHKTHLCLCIWRKKFSILVYKNILGTHTQYSPNTTKDILQNLLLTYISSEWNNSSEQELHSTTQ